MTSPSAWSTAAVTPPGAGRRPLVEPVVDRVGDGHRGSGAIGVPGVGKSTSDDRSFGGRQEDLVDEGLVLVDETWHATVRSVPPWNSRAGVGAERADLPIYPDLPKPVSDRTTSSEVRCRLRPDSRRSRGDGPAFSPYSDSAGCARWAFVTEAKATRVERSVVGGHDGVVTTADQVRIVPANESTFEELQAILGGRGPGHRCQCQRYKLAPGESFGAVPVRYAPSGSANRRTVGTRRRTQRVGSLLTRTTHRSAGAPSSHVPPTSDWCARSRCRGKGARRIAPIRVSGR